MSQPTGAFSVDLERAQDAIRELEQAKAELEKIRNDAMLLSSVTPPAADQVSIDAAKALGAAAHGGPRSFVLAANAGIERLRELIERLRQDLKGYEDSDHVAARALEVSNGV